MSTGKQSKFLTIYFSALVAGGLVLGYLAWSASSKAEEAEAEYKKAERDLDALEGAKLSRTEENAKKKKALVAEYVTKVQALNSDLMKYQAPLNAAETNTSFQTKLQAATDAARATAKDKQVKLDEKFDARFDRSHSLMVRACIGLVASVVGILLAILLAALLG